jgi:class 3 adenylate cyclase
LDRLRNRLLSLRFSLAGAFVSIVLLTVLLLGSILYLNIHAFILDDLRGQLRSAVGVAALQIEARDHERIRSRADESSPEYLRIRRQLQAVRGRSRGVRYVYTIRKNASGQIVFVVDAAEDPAELSHVADVYPKPTPAMLAVFVAPPAAHVDKQFATDQWGTFISGFAPLVDPAGRICGALGMDLSAAHAASFENHFLAIALAGLAGIALLVVALSVVLAGRISQPLTHLALDMGRIQNFDLDTPIAIRSRIQEVVQMKTSLEDMKRGLRSFKRYVPADLVSDLIKLEQEAVLGAERRALTVLFSDIEGFTTLSESMPPDRLSEILGVYFEGMTRAILDEGGTVDKFVGDSIMAFWGAPHPVADHAARACRAALRCQEFIGERFGRRRREGEPSFATRIGINSGEAYVGNFGFPERLSYTAMGDSVNLASRLEGMNKHYGTRLLVSESTLVAAGGGFSMRPIDRVAVKGRHQGVWVYELVGRTSSLPPDSQDFVARCAKAVGLYRERKWAQAAEAFADLGRLRPQDQPARILGERCRGFALRPPPDDWDGVFVLHEK